MDDREGIQRERPVITISKGSLFGDPAKTKLNMCVRMTVFDVGIFAAITTKMDRVVFLCEG